MGKELDKLVEKCENYIEGVNLTFGDAVEYMKQGKKVKRKGWGGYWFISKVPVDTGKKLWIEPFIIARLQDETFAPAQPYQADILAEDWEIVNE